MAYMISSGETSSGIVLNSNESMAVLDGGIALTTTVNQYGSMTVFSGGTAFDTTVDRGQFTVSSGGTAGITTINNSRGLAIVSSGGTATAVSAGSGGKLELTVAPDTYFEGDSNARQSLLRRNRADVLFRFLRRAVEPAVHSVSMKACCPQSLRRSTMSERSRPAAYSIRLKRSLRQTGSL